MPPVPIAPPEIFSSFTVLETTLISILVAIVAGFSTFISMGKRFMTRNECNLNHDSRSAADDQIQTEIKKITASQNLQFMMLREIIVYMDIPADIKTKILNMKVN